MTPEELLAQLKDGTNAQAEVYKGKDPMWLYHFSTMRWNLLDWYPFQPDQDILQIGCGYGAMLGLFSKRMHGVCGVTNDPIQEEINIERYKDVENIRIIRCDLASIPEGKYDYVYLECGEEGANKMLNEDQNLVTLIETAYPYLKKDGKFIIALNNAIGISRLAGGKDYHAKDFFDESKCVEDGLLYSQAELKNIISKQDLELEEMYYPIPDFRLPREIYSSKYLPKEGTIRQLGYSYGQLCFSAFPEDDVMREMCKNKCFEQMANSFLVIATKN